MKMNLIQQGIAAMTATLLIASSSLAGEPTATDMVDALNGVFGKHAGARASHAKGFCAQGSFIPASNASKFTKAKLLGEKSLTATMRFSIGGGNPAASDKSRSVRGLAVRLSGVEETYDLALISEPVFFASTPASFVSFLDARRPDSATKKPDPAKIEAHNHNFPEGKLQPSLLAAHPAPASYGSTPYYSNHAFKFVDSHGGETWARLVAEPTSGTHYLTAEEEKSLPDSFLETELKARLEKEPVTFDLYAQPKGDHDSITDPASTWSGKPAKITMGHLIIERITGQSCDSDVLVPTNLPVGIEASDDPILKMRGVAYAVSKSRRSPY